MADRHVKVTLTANVTEYTRSVNRAANETDELRRSAERFGARSYKAKLDVEIPASALAKLGMIQNRLDRIDGRTATARVRINDGGTGKRAMLIASALFAIGPAAVAGATVAGAALTSLALTAGTLIAGLGVGILAFQGVGKALKAMNDADSRSAEDSAASATQRVQSYRSISDAAKQVSRAQRDGAEAVAAAERRVEDAQAGVIQSQKRVKDSLDELHIAREQAVRDLEDLKDKSHDDGLDEEAAQIRLIDAQNSLNAVQGDALASSLDLRKAKLELAQAEDNLSDVQRQSKRDTVDLTKAEKAGVEGAANVVQAKDNVTSANSDLIKSQQDLKDAQADVAKAQTAAAESVSDAQLGLQRAIEDAASAMDDQSASAAKLARELSKLGPEGQAFVQYLHDLGPLMQRLQNTAQSNMFPGLTSGAEAAKRALPELDTMIRGVSSAIGAVGKEAGDTFSSPFWRGYFKFIADEATPTFMGFFRILERITRGLAGMQKAFSPFTKEIIADLERMTQRFANWGTTLGSSAGFSDFMAYIHRVGPQVMDTLKSLGNALLDVGKAMGNAAPMVLVALSAFAHLISALAGLPVIGTALFGFASALGAAYLASRLFSMIGGTATFAFLSKLPGLITSASLSLGVYTERIALAAGASSTFAATSGVAVATAGSKIGGALSKIGSTLPLIGAAFILGSIAIDAWGSKAEENADKVVKGSMSVKQAIDEETKHRLTWTIGEKDQNEVMRAEIQARNDVMTAINKQLDKMDPLQRAQANVFMAQTRVNDSLHSFNVPAGEAEAAAQNLKDKTSDLATEQTIAALGVDRHTASLYNLIDAQQKARDSSNSLERADIALRKQFETTTAAEQDSKLSSDDKRLAELDLEDAIRRAADALAEKTVKDAEAAGASDLGKVKADAQRDAYKNLAATVEDPLRSQILKLGEDTLHLPDKTTTLTVDGKLGNMADFGAAIDKIKNILVATSAGLSGQNAASGIHLQKADGGYIAGAGSGTSDSIPAMLSNGEYVVKAAAVSSVGLGALNHINNRGALPGYAAGGVVMHGNMPGLGAQRNSMTNGAAEAAWGPLAMIKAMAGALANNSYSGVAGTGYAAPPGQIADWINQALNILGLPANWAGPAYTLIQRESGGNPTIVNTTDSNWRAGTPSVGLMQVIGPTYASNRPPAGYDVGPYSYGTSTNPLANILSGLTYIRNRYGSIFNVQQANANAAPRGYDSGGIANGVGVMAKNTLQPERVLSPRQTSAFDQLVAHITRPATFSGPGGAGDKHYHLTVVNAGGSRVNLQAQFKRLELMSGV